MRLSRKDAILGCDFETAQLQCVTLNKFFQDWRIGIRTGLEGEGGRELKKKIQTLGTGF